MLACLGQVSYRLVLAGYDGFVPTQFILSVPVVAVGRSTSYIYRGCILLVYASM